LSGHSFGGYVVANYALKYRHHVKKLLLLSPIGIHPQELHDEGPDQEELEKKFNMQSHPQWFTWLAEFTWKNQISPFGMNRFLG